MRNSGETVTTPELGIKERKEFVMRVYKYKGITQLVPGWDSESFSTSISKIEPRTARYTAWLAAFDLAQFFWSDDHRDLLASLDLERPIGEFPKRMLAKGLQLKNIPQDVWFTDSKTKSGLMYEILATCDGATRLFESKAELFKLPDPIVTESTEKFRDVTAVPGGEKQKAFVDYIQRASTHEEFPRPFFDTDEVAQEYLSQALLRKRAGARGIIDKFTAEKQSKTLNLDQALLHGIYNGLNERENREEEEFKLLIGRLQEAKEKARETQVNAEQCRVESEIIGYLIGRKVINKGDSYIPEVLVKDKNKYPLLPIWKLNAIANHSFRPFMSERPLSEKLEPLQKAPVKVGRE